MTLSPAAQAVMDAALHQIADDLNVQDQALTTSVIAAALRAAVEQVLPNDRPFHHGPSATRLAEHVRGELLAIATELENPQ